MKRKTKRIKIFCRNGKPIEITKTYAENIRRQILKTIKAKRIENRDMAEFYFYGIAEFSYVKETDETVLLINYGGVSSSSEVDKKGRIYAEVPIRVKPSKKKAVILENN